MEDETTTRKFYLGGLDSGTTEESLRSYFDQFGTITDCIVMREPSTKSSRRYGFVTYSTNDEADSCFNSGPHTVDGKEIDLQRAMPKGGKSKAEAGKKLFVGGLNPETTDEGLKQYFDQFGEVVDCIVMKHKDTSRSRCFGFVTYSNTDMVDTVQQNRPHTIDGSKVETKRATTREDSSRGDSGKTVKKIFVGGFKSKLEDSDMESYFGSYGTITFCKQILEKGTGKKLGFGFVEFDDYDPVDKIIIQGQHEINGVHVDIRKALGKDEVQGGGRGGFGGKRGAAGGAWGGQGGYGGGYNNGYGGGWGGSQGGFGGGDSWGQSQGGYGGSWGQGAAAGGGWSDPSGGWGAGASGGGYMGDGGWGGGYGASGGMGGGGGAMRNSMGGRGNSTPYSGGRGGGRGRGGNSGGAGRW